MGKRDAFGNEIDGDNPLDAMGWKVGEESTAPAVSVEANDPTGVASAPPVAPAPPVMTASGGTPRFEAPRMPTQLPNIPAGRTFDASNFVGRFIGLAIALAIFGGIGVAVWAAVDSAKDTVNRFTIPRFTTPNVSVPTPAKPVTPGTPTKAESPSEPPVGLSRGSLLRASEFGNVLSAIRAVGGRVQTMRVDPQRISANVVSGDGRLTIVSVPWNGNTQIVRTSSNLASASTVSLSAITSKSASRAVARAAKALGKPASQLNYMVVLDIGGRAQWYVYFKDGKYVRASLDGRSVQRVN